MEGSSCGLLLRYYRDISLMGLWKSTRNLIEYASPQTCSTVFLLVSSAYTYFFVLNIISIQISDSTFKRLSIWSIANFMNHPLPLPLMLCPMGRLQIRLAGSHSSECDCFSVQRASNMPLDENMGIIDVFSCTLTNLPEARKEQAQCRVAYFL